MKYHNGIHDEQFATIIEVKTAYLAVLRHNDLLQKRIKELLQEVYIEKQEALANGNALSQYIDLYHNSIDVNKKQQNDCNNNITVLSTKLTQLQIAYDILLADYTNTKIIELTRVNIQLAAQVATLTDNYNIQKQQLLICERVARKYNPPDWV
jgi:hypothetical protein